MKGSPVRGRKAAEARWEKRVITKIERYPPFFFGTSIKPLIIIFLAIL